jgi:squalene-hopene/tetraprenyl-beta-curcumene cyclase
MQNRDGGFGAFDVDNDALYLNKIPFSDMDALCDPSWACVTGRVLEAFGMLLHSPHKEKIQDSLLPRIKLASIRAIEFLASTNQRGRENGAWYGRWGVNYVYGTSNVLCGLEHFVECPHGCVDVGSGFGEDYESLCPKENCAQHFDYPTRLARSLIPSAITFLKSCQNTDGGWGESLSTYRNPSLAGKGRSRPSQTAWALIGLLAHLPPGDEAIVDGVEWLVREQVDMEDGGKGGRSWKEEFHTGVGFPNFYYLGYDYYRHYFPMMALGRWSRGMQKGEGRNAQGFDGVDDQTNAVKQS